MKLNQQTIKMLLEVLGLEIVNVDNIVYKANIRVKKLGNLYSILFYLYFYFLNILYSISTIFFMKQIYIKIIKKMYRANIFISMPIKAVNSFLILDYFE